MKTKLVTSLIVAALSFANSAYADITIQSSAVNACSNISGSWVGDGSLSSWALKCGYHGSGTASQLDGSGRFRMSIAIDKSSGSLVCPKHVSFTLPASCSDGYVTIHTDVGNLHGNISGNSGSVKGKIAVTSVIKGDVSINLRKVG